MDISQRMQQVRSRSILQQVSTRSRAHSLQQVFLILMHGEKDDASPGTVFLNQPGGFE
jgi:hypothetical protein